MQTTNHCHTMRWFIPFTTATPTPTTKLCCYRSQGTAIILSPYRAPPHQAQQHQRGPHMGQHATLLSNLGETMLYIMQDNGCHNDYRQHVAHHQNNIPGHLLSPADPLRPAYRIFWDASVQVQNSADDAQAGFGLLILPPPAAQDRA